MLPLISVGVKDPMQTAFIDPVVPVYQRFATSYSGGCEKWLKVNLHETGVGSYSFPPDFILLTRPAASFHFILCPCSGCFSIPP